MAAHSTQLNVLLYDNFTLLDAFGPVDVLCRLDGVMSACVLPVERRGTLSHLAGYVVSRKAPEAEGASNLERVQAVKDGLRAFLPEYMIPRKIVFIDEMPLGASGKVDRKRLQERG